MVYIAKPTSFTVDTVDWTDIVKGVTLAGGEDIVPARTFGAPRATTTGGGQDAVTIGILWSAAAAALVAAEAGTDVVMALEADGGSYGATIHVPDAPPVGAHMIGEAVEVDLVCGVTDEIAFTPPA